MLLIQRMLQKVGFGVWFDVGVWTKKLQGFGLDLYPSPILMHALKTLLSSANGDSGMLGGRSPNHPTITKFKHSNHSCPERLVRNFVDRGFRNPERAITREQVRRLCAASKGLFSPDCEDSLLMFWPMCAEATPQRTCAVTLERQERGLTRPESWSPFAYHERLTLQHSQGNTVRSQAPSRLRTRAHK